MLAVEWQASGATSLTRMWSQCHLRQKMSMRRKCNSHWSEAFQLSQQPWAHSVWCSQAMCLTPYIVLVVVLLGMVMVIVLFPLSPCTTYNYASYYHVWSFAPFYFMRQRTRMLPEWSSSSFQKCQVPLLIVDIDCCCIVGQVAFFLWSWTGCCGQEVSLFGLQHLCTKLLMRTGKYGQVPLAS